MTIFLMRVIWAALFFFGLLIFNAGNEAQAAGSDEVWLHFKNILLLIWVMWTTSILFPFPKKRGPGGE